MKRAESGSECFAASLPGWATHATFVFPHLCLGANHLRLGPFSTVIGKIPTLASVLVPVSGV